MIEIKSVKRKIIKLEENGHPAKRHDTHWGAWFSLGWRVALEWLVAVLVGYGVGTFLDEWLHSDPWGLIVFLLFGNIAGLLNIYRTYRNDVKTF